MVELGIDEATLVLQPVIDARPGDSEFSSWDDQAVCLALGAAGKLDCSSVFGDRHSLERCPSGYNAGFTYGENDFYFAIAYSRNHPGMGVVIKFSAQALAFYTRETGKEFWQVLQALQSPDCYTVRPSRIDLTADFIDEGISVDDIYRQIDSGRMAVYRKQLDREGNIHLRRSASSMRGYFSGDKVQTFYLGSLKKNTKSLLRIYDKRSEQIETHGVRAMEARRCSNWVRFEASLRHLYAQQFGDALLSCRSDGDFVACISKLYSDRYLFRMLDGSYAPWTEALGGCADDSAGLLLASPSCRKADLARAAAHIANGSGLFSLMFKLDKIWGSGSSQELVEWLRGWYERYAPNDDAASWVKRHAATYRDEFSTVSEWLSEASELLSDVES